jgi:hypothetical protein
MEGFSFVTLVTGKEDDDEITGKVLDHESAHCTETNYF